MFFYLKFNERMFLIKNVKNVLIKWFKSFMIIFNVNFHYYMYSHIKLDPFWRRKASYKGSFHGKWFFSWNFDGLLQTFCFSKIGNLWRHTIIASYSHTSTLPSDFLRPNLVSSWNLPRPSVAPRPRSRQGTRAGQS